MIMIDFIFIKCELNSHEYKPLLKDKQNSEFSFFKWCTQTLFPRNIENVFISDKWILTLDHINCDKELCTLKSANENISGIKSNVHSLMEYYQRINGRKEFIIFWCLCSSTWFSYNKSSGFHDRKSRSDAQSRLTSCETSSANRQFSIKPKKGIISRINLALTRFFFQDSSYLLCTRGTGYGLVFTRSGFLKKVGGHWLMGLKLK